MVFAPLAVCAGLKLPHAPVGEDAATTTFITRPGMILGTLPYMSPEQTRCEALDGRSDLYSLGVVLYELATGELPVRGSDDILKLPAGLGPILARLTEAEAGKRYQTATAAREAFQELCARDAFQRCGVRPALR